MPQPRLKTVAFAANSQFAALVLVSMGNPVFAQESQNLLEVSAGYGYSDNVARQPENPTTSGMSIVGLNADWSTERPLYSITFDGDFDYIFYEDEQLRDRPDGRLNLDLTTHLVPDRIDWSVFNEFTQVRQDINLGDAPDNLRKYNVLGTTLDLRLPIGQRTSIGGTGTFERRDADTSLDLNSDSITVGVNLSRQISRNRTLALVVDTSEIKYDDLLETEYEIHRAFLRYQSVLASGDVQVDLGANRLRDTSPAEDPETEPLFRLTWQRDLTPRSRLLLSGVYQWSDLGSSAALGGNPSDENSGILNPTSEPFRDRRAALDLLTNLTATSIRLALSASDQEFDNPFVQDSSFYAVNLQITRQLSRGFSFSIGGSYGDRRSEDPFDDSQDIFANAGVRKSLGRRFSILFSYQYRNREAENGSGFEENQFRLELIARLQN